MKPTTVELFCCGKAIPESRTDIYYLNAGFPVFIDRHFTCGSCGGVSVLEVNDPTERERIAGHLMDPKALAPLCCLETMQEREPQVFLLSYPVEIFRIYVCQYCREHQSFKVTDPAKHDEIISSYLNKEAS